MPSPKRWFPVSHDFFTDLQVQRLRVEHGPNAVLFWLWILSRLDQTENAFRFTENEFKSCHNVSGIYLKTVDKLLTKFEQYGWIVRQNGVLSSPNYTKYHRVRKQPGSPPILSEPIRTEPSEEKKKKEGIARMDGKPSRASAFPGDWKVEAWMEDLCKGFALNPHAEFAEFRNHHLAKGTVFKSWPHAFRTWVDRSVKIKQTGRAR